MMILEKFARKTRGKGPTKVVTSRLPKSVYDDFKQYCDSLGLTISEAVNLLITHELKGFIHEEKQKVYNSNTKSIQTVEKSIQNDSKVIQTVSEKNTKVFNSSNGRFTTKKWQVNNYLPCPVCTQWVSATNFARHAKDHGKTTQDIFTNPMYAEKLEIMTAKKKGVKS